jgi:hypothetical protein
MDMCPFEDSVYGPLGVVDVTMSQWSEVLSGPSLLLGCVAELVEGNIWGAVNTLRQRHVMVVVFYSESGITERCDNGGPYGAQHITFLSRVE